MCISIVGSLVSMLTPDGEGGGISKNMRLIFGLCVVIVCINPIKEMVVLIDELDIGSVIDIPEEDEDKYNDIFNSSYTSAEIENLKMGIKQMLSDRFDIDSSECSVSVNSALGDGGRNMLKSITVILYGSAIFKNTDEIERYFENIFGCEVITAIG